MKRTDFKLTPDSYLLVELSLIQKHPHEGETVHNELSKAKVFVYDTGTYGYATVSCGLQSAVCTALDALIDQLGEKTIDN